MSAAIMGQGADNWPSPARAWWVMFVLFITAIVYYTDRFILNLLVDPIRADLQITDTQVSLLQGVAFTFVYAMAGLPLGRFADILPRRRVMVAAVTVWSLATVACGFARSFEELFIARMLVGIGEAALAPAAVSIIGDYFPPHRRGTAIGVFMTGMSVGGSLSIAAGGGLLQAANGGLFAGIPGFTDLAPWRSVLVLLAVPSLLVVALLLTVREPARQGGTEGGQRTPLKDVLAGFVERRHILVPLYVAVAMASVGDCALHNWTPSLLSRRFEYTPGEIGTLLGGVSLAMGVIGSLFGGMLSDHLYRRGGSRARLLAASLFALLMIGGSMVALAGNGLTAIALYALWAVMSSIAATIGVTMIQETITSPMRGVGTSLVSFGNILVGMSLGTSLTAVFTDYVYGDPLAVGWSITSVAAPAGLVSALMFYRALRRS